MSRGVRFWIAMFAFIVVVGTVILASVFIWPQLMTQNSKPTVTVRPVGILFDTAAPDE
jgi:hypothetical protein